MMMSLVSNILFPPPPSIFITAMSVIGFASLATGLSEFRGNHFQYSKFSSTGPQNAVKLPSRIGMLILYTPAFVAALLGLIKLSNDGLRFMLVGLALTIHFLKRIFEVLLIHQYSGQIVLDTVIPISVGYCLSTATMIYNQHLTHNMPEPPLDLKYAGVALFLVGTVGNFYQHITLSKLRGKDNKGYKIPKGGLFNLVVCPHYLFEILTWCGVCFISQTVYPFCYNVGTTFYLMGRSYATRKWYLYKFPEFPKEVKALIPYVF